ncbi:MAG: cytochrome c oxidase subunit I [Planctomycetota bacterium]|jgi:cytochrome c oxidase subunit 1
MTATTQQTGVNRLPTTGKGAPDQSNYLTASRGLRSWLFTLDHKRIGMMYLISVLGAFLVGGLLALSIRLELLTPEKTVMEADTYNHAFTLHGAVMVFLFIIPSIPAALGNFVLPVMLGAKDVAFPRMNLASYYLWVFGAVFLLAAIALNGLDTGWTFYTPYSTTTNSSVITATAGVFILGFSSIFTGINFIATLHTMRPKGMTWFRMPLFLWSLYATSIIQVLATPVLSITLLLLIAEKALGIGIFDPKLGGDPVLYQHFFWFYSHPAVYIMILPAMGIISDLIAVHAHRHIFGYRYIAFSSVAIAMFGFLVWGHHMFTSGQSPLMNVIFSAITFSVSIPSAIKVFNWTATLYKGSISFTTPMLYALSFIFIFAIGGLTGLHLGTLATDIHLHDTYFVVAHFHYVMMGSAILAMIGGLHHWWPKMTGRMYSEKWGRIACGMVFFGFNGTFLPQFVMGSQGMPRRYHDYSNMNEIYHFLGQTMTRTEYFEFWHKLSTYGSYLMGLGFLLTAVYLIHSLFAGKRAPANPWGGMSLEWHCSSPPPPHNFDEAPTVGDCYDFSSLEWSEEEQGYVTRADAKKPELTDDGVAE